VEADRTRLLTIMCGTGEVLENMELVSHIEALGTPTGTPKKRVVIARSGTVKAIATSYVYSVLNRDNEGTNRSLT
jgi:hypothetical protein